MISFGDGNHRRAIEHHSGFKGDKPCPTLAAFAAFHRETEITVTHRSLQRNTLHFVIMYPFSRGADKIFQLILTQFLTFTTLERVQL
jgi:hypothetical protein